MSDKFMNVVFTSTYFVIQKSQVAQLVYRLALKNTSYPNYYDIYYINRSYEYFRKV